jgi:hypothetical protein
VGELWKPPAKGMAGVGRLVAELDSRGLHSAATYLRNAGEELFTVTRLKEQGIAPELVLVATSPSQGRTSAVERELREIKRRTEVGARRSDEGVERVARLLEEVRLNGTRVEFYA